MRIETKSEIGEFFRKLQEYLKKNKIFKNHYINIADFDDSNPRVWGMAISIFPIGTKDELFQQQNGDNLFIYNIQFRKEWHRTERVIIFALWAGENAEKAEEFKRLKKEWSNKSNQTKSGFSYNVDNDGNYLDLSKRNIPNELKEMPYEIEEKLIFPIIEKTLEKLYADYNDKFYELFNLRQSDKYHQIIDTYIDFCDKNEWNEEYKWETVKLFQQKWYSNIKEEEFKELLKQILDIQTNLISWQNKDNINKITENYSENFKQVLNSIFDENRSIEKRFEYFKAQIEQIGKELNRELNLSEDVFAFFLTCRYPEKYYFYRFEYYKKFCEYIEKQPVSKKDTSGNKYYHYLKIIQHLNDQYVKNNLKVQNITKYFLEKKDLKILDNKNILTQSIIWITFGHSGGQIYNMEENQNMENNIILSNPLNQILFGPPGTGKTYHTINKAIEIVDNKFYNQNINNRTELKKRFKELKESNQIVFTTFHQSMSYEEFLESLKPFEENKQVYYKIEDGIFKQICEEAKEKTTENFVLIIDEINRGNIASIFGELITLIEPDKRKDEDEELSVKLPYSKQDFTVPNNLYIIGTMNTADRSVEALDSALRRRFVFNEMPPNATLLNKDFFGINLQEVLSKINLRIEKLIDKDHKIGHSYFINLKSEIDLQNAFKNKIIPLLEEYFYGDFAKIGLILGADFVSKNNIKENIFKNIDDIENYTDFENRIIYKTSVPENIDEFINAVKNIYS